jgi:glycerol kinase
LPDFLPILRTIEKTMKKYMFAPDRGTASSRPILFDKKRYILEERREFPQMYPKEGWVDPMERDPSQYAVVMEPLTKYGIAPSDVAAIGITSRRETAILWDKPTGRPAIRETTARCAFRERRGKCLAGRRNAVTRSGGWAAA